MDKEAAIDAREKSYDRLKEELKVACSLRRETPPTEQERQRARPRLIT